MFSFINLLVDVLYAYADPRIKSQYKRGRKPRKKSAKMEVAA
jgi:peptide/nickel transport system permease protein